MQNKISLLDPVKIGAIECKNRIFMAPKTRLRCNPADGIATDLVAEYYA